MSSGNVQFELTQCVGEAPSTTPVRLINVFHATYGKACIFGYVGGAPGTYATSAGQWNDGAICIDTVNGTIYRNTASITTTPSWSAMS